MEKAILICVDAAKAMKEKKGERLKTKPLPS